MKYSEAKKLKKGDTVVCPGDVDRPAFTTTVTTEGLGSAQVYKNDFGDKYIWVGVKDPVKNTELACPSNQLSHPEG